MVFLGTNCEKPDSLQTTRTLKKFIINNEND